MSFDLNDALEELDEINLELNDMSFENEISVIVSVQNQGKLDRESQLVLFRDLFAIDRRCNSIVDSDQDVVLKADERDCIILADDLERILSPFMNSVYNCSNPFREEQPSVDTERLGFNLVLENNVDSGSYILPSGSKIDETRTLLVFEARMQVSLGDCLVYTSNSNKGVPEVGAYMFKGEYEYVKTDLYGRTHWSRISNTISIRYERESDIFRFLKNVNNKNL